MAVSLSFQEKVYTASVELESIRERGNVISLKKKNTDMVCLLPLFFFLLLPPPHVKEAENPCWGQIESIKIG